MISPEQLVPVVGEVTNPDARDFYHNELGFVGITIVPESHPPKAVVEFYDQKGWETAVITNEQITVEGLKTALADNAKAKVYVDVAKQMLVDINKGSDDMDIVFDGPVILQ